MGVRMVFFDKFSFVPLGPGAASNEQDGSELMRFWQLSGRFKVLGLRLELEELPPPSRSNRLDGDGFGRGRPDGVALPIKEIDPETRRDPRFEDTEFDASPRRINQWTAMWSVGSTSEMTVLSVVSFLVSAVGVGMRMFVDM